jgi:hypothetical protein
MQKGTSVEVVHVNNLPKKISSSHNLGVRQIGAKGVIVAATVPGFDSDAVRVELRDEFGERIGQWGIYFPGEIEPIPDLPPAPELQ